MCCAVLCVRACVCVSLCVSNCMSECICINVCLSAYELRSQLYKCRNINVLDEGGGHVAEAQCLRWMCEARHRTTCITDRHTRPDKLSHGVAHRTHSNGGEVDVYFKPFIDIVILQTCLYLQTG